jgi:hypothetical protein
MYYYKSNFIICKSHSTINIITWGAPLYNHSLLFLLIILQPPMSLMRPVSMMRMAFFRSISMTMWMSLLSTIVFPRAIVFKFSLLMIVIVIVFMFGIVAMRMMFHGSIVLVIPIMIFVVPVMVMITVVSRLDRACLSTIMRPRCRHRLWVRIMMMMPIFFLWLGLGFG